MRTQLNQEKKKLSPAITSFRPEIGSERRLSFSRISGPTTKVHQQHLDAQKFVFSPAATIGEVRGGWVYFLGSASLPSSPPKTGKGTTSNLILGEKGGNSF